MKGRIYLMNLGAIIGPMLMSLIEGVIENRFTRQNMKDKVDEIVHVANYNERVKDTEIKQKNEYIQLLENKIKEVEEKIKAYADAGIESLEKIVEQKLPYVPEFVVDKVGEVVKDAVHEVMDKAVEELDSLVETEAKQFGLDSEPEKVDVSKPADPVPVKSTSDFLSDSAKEILDNLKKDQGD
jgi:type I site-specific restriction endonuclease